MFAGIISDLRKAKIGGFLYLVKGPAVFLLRTVEPAPNLMPMDNERMPVSRAVFHFARREMKLTAARGIAAFEYTRILSGRPLSSSPFYLLCDVTFVKT